MSFSFESSLQLSHDEQFAKYAQYVNPQFARVLKTIGFDKQYVRGEGCYVYDDKGEKYLDFLAGYGVFNVGRSNPYVKDALKYALDADFASMVQMDAPLPAAVLAERLLQKVKGKTQRVFWCNSGTEAVEGALKFVRKASGRQRVLYFDHAFHGLTNGSLSVNGNKEFKRDFGELLPGCVGIPLGDLETLERELRYGDVAALIIEPIQGKGVYAEEASYYQDAEKLCHHYGAYVIADEIQTGMGRTGKWFAHHAYDIQPDIVLVAKGLSGGYIPVGAICYSEEIYTKVFRSMDECVVHSCTFGRNHLAMIAGLATLDYMEEANLVQNAKLRGEEIKSRILALKPKYEMLSDVRGEGLILAFEFGEPKSMKLKAGWKLVHAVNAGLFGQMVVIPLMRDHHVLTQVAGHNMDVVKILPPLCIGQAEVDHFVNAFEQVMQLCHTFPGSIWSVGKDLAVAAAKSARMRS